MLGIVGIRVNSYVLAAGGGGGTGISTGWLSSPGGGGVVEGVGFMDVMGERRFLMSSSICFIIACCWIIRRFSAASCWSFCCFAICIICFCSSSISSTSSSSSGCIGWACAGVGALPFGGMLNFVNGDFDSREPEWLPGATVFVRGVCELRIALYA